MMLKVGLTGNIGAGKSTVARIFRQLGVPVFIADLHARLITNQPAITRSIENALGPGVIGPDGLPDRRKLAEVVFASKEKLAILNAIVHPAVRAEFENWCESYAAQPFVLQEAAILFESGLAPLFDRIIIVSAPEEIRIDRVARRDNLSHGEIRKRIDSQWSEEKKIGLSDFVIFNDGEQMVIPQVLKVWRTLIGEAMEKTD